MGSLVRYRPSLTLRDDRYRTVGKHIGIFFKDGPIAKGLFGVVYLGPHFIDGYQEHIGTLVIITRLKFVTGIRRQPTHVLSQLEDESKILPSNAANEHMRIVQHQIVPFPVERHAHFFLRRL